MRVFLIFIAFSVFLFTDCNSGAKKMIEVEGIAQGTTYHITYLSDDNINYQPAIDSLLRVIDTSMSTYMPSSIISGINRNDSNVLVDRHFVYVFNKSMEVSEKTGGLFDVTVGPLVNAWGFGFNKKAFVDSSLIDSILQYIGYKMVKLAGNRIIKEKPQIKLDFNAIAQGYSVDVIANFLESKRINNYLVELGGELKAKGKKYYDDWKIGIDQPIDSIGNNRKLQAIINFSDRAMATSGSYRRFYEEGGQKFSHIIDPRTGYPARQNLLSATVIADDCITADAYATAFIVMGLERSKQFLTDSKDLNLEVFFIYDEKGNWKTFSSESLKKLIQELN